VLHVKRILKNRVYQIYDLKQSARKIPAAHKMGTCSLGALQQLSENALEDYLLSVCCCSCVSTNEGLQARSTNPQHPRKNGTCIYGKYDSNSSQDGIGFQ
jgi:hypothetical protein